MHRSTPINLICILLLGLQIFYEPNIIKISKSDKLLNIRNCIQLSISNSILLKSILLKWLKKVTCCWTTQNQIRRYIKNCSQTTFKIWPKSSKRRDSSLQHNWAGIAFTYLEIEKHIFFKLFDFSFGLKNSLPSASAHAN